MWPWVILNRILQNTQAILGRVHGCSVEHAEILQLLKAIAFRVYRPGPVTIRITSEGLDSMLKFEVDLPPATAPDVTKGELVVAIGTADPFTIETAINQLVVQDDRLAGADNESVGLSFTFTDDAGNVSVPSVASFVLTDTIAPGQPGALGLRVTVEE